MKLLRKLLFPFSILYGTITSFRNFLYDKGILKSYSFALPVIAVGNLSMGGTGKSPQIEYLIHLLSSKFKIATLSRGYKRKSEGFILANKNSNALEIGDEPYQFYLKFPEIQVAVDADRKNGITQLLAQDVPPQLILLDDAFQHRKVKAGFYIMLTAYDDLYCDDFILPMGNLRETRAGASRANIVVVTKCPKDLSVQTQLTIKKQLNLKEGQHLYFTFIAYADSVYSKKGVIEVSNLAKESKILLAGIAKPEPFFEYLKQDQDECLTFSDHHHFSDEEIESIQQKAKGRKIITTEKDYVRLKDTSLSDQLYYLPIQSSFLNDGKDFDQNILEYVGKSSRNR